MRLSQQLLDAFLQTGEDLFDLGLITSHAHPVHAIALSLERKEVRPADAEGAVLLKEVPILSLPSIDAVVAAERGADLLKDSVAVMVRGHGCFAKGNTLEEALARTSSLEASCGILTLLNRK